VTPARFDGPRPSSEEKPVSRFATANVALQLRVEVQPGADPAVIEQLVAGEGRRAARELYREMIRALDEDAVAAVNGSRQRLEERWLATLMGRIRIARYRVKVGARSLHPLDTSLGLGRSEVSPALSRLVVALSSTMSYRNAAQIVSWITGEPVSPQACMRIARRALRALRATGSNGST
jgi:hypothetical protein